MFISVKRSEQKHWNKSKQVAAVAFPDTQKKSDTENGKLTHYNAPIIIFMSEYFY